MKIYAYLALIGVAFFTPIAASAAQPDSNQGSGKYEWRSFPLYGKYFGTHVSRRVWVADNQQTASANCDMKKMSNSETANCMKHMVGMAAMSGSMMKMSSAEAASCMKVMSGMAR